MQSESIFEGHLHPLTVVFGLLRAGRAIIPVIPLLWFGNRLWSAFLLMMIVASTVVTTLVRYFTFSYRIEGNELITQQGLLERKQRSIPLERIQEIRVEQGVLHRVFDVVDAKIETGSGGGAEASLSVLSRAEVERLRRAVFERAAAIAALKQEAGMAEPQIHGASEPPERVVIRQLGIWDLVKLGLTTNHLISAMALAGALWNFADDIFPDGIYREAADYLYRETEKIVAQDTATTFILTILGFLAIFTIGVVISTAGSIVLFYGFTFSRSGEDLHRRYGLFTRRSSSLPRRRIQVLKIEEKMFRRLFGLATLRADTSGSSRENEDDNEGRDVLVPIVKRNEVDGLLPTFFPDLDADVYEWQRVSRLAIRRGTIKGALLCVLAAAVSFYTQESIAGLWPLGFLPVIYYVNVARYRSLGYAVGESYFQTRRGWLGRSTHIVPIHKIQAVLIHQTPFDRRLGLATLSVDTAGQAYTGGGPQISNLPIDQARSIAATLARKASVTRFRW
jgi:putative membrane protein